MNESGPKLAALPPDGNSDLEAVLAAWHDATVRLEGTHNALRAEVRRLTDELEAKNVQLARKNRLADLGQMASHVAHEVRNSLVSVTLYLSLLRRRISDDSGSVDVVDRICGDLTSLDAIVGDLLSFSSERAPKYTAVPVRTIVSEIVDSLRPQLDAQHVEPDLDIPASLTVSADREMLRRALLNLTLNALDAMPDGGQLVVTAIDSGHRIELEIADSGLGLNDEVIGRAFEPFFTTKSTGTGLGLAIVDQIAQAHGATVEAANCPEGGAAFTLCFARTQVLEAAA